VTEGVFQRTILFYHSSAAVVNGNFAAMSGFFRHWGGDEELFQWPTPTAMVQFFQGCESDLADALTGPSTCSTGLFAEESS
jgi:hypothetical protein